MKSLFFSVVAILLCPTPTIAQFYTIKDDSARITTHRFIKPKQLNKQIIVKAEKHTETQDTWEEVLGSPPPFIHTIKRMDSIATPRNRVDSVLNKLAARLNVCLPLDLLRITSKYGTRQDPITQCQTFHDGVDLLCRRESVYAMLPAVVKKTYKGNKGYGNYVVLDHGQLECLYGHLDAITVKEGDVINAGTIVGISGNTGKSTGYHLHIRLRYGGKSVDPSVFITFLKTYINDLNKGLSHIVPTAKSDITTSDLTLQAVYQEVVKKNILFPKIVVAQAILETGYFSSRVCLEYNNLFGLRRRNGEYYRFKTWQESVDAYRNYVQYKYTGGDYFTFLDHIGYAEDKNYTAKVRTIVNTITNKVGES